MKINVGFEHYPKFLRYVFGFSLYEYGLSIEIFGYEFYIYLTNDNE